MNKQININTSILIIEDESVIAIEIESFVRKLGFHVAGVVDSYDEALAVLSNQKVDILLCDIYLKGEKSGIDLVRKVKNQQASSVIYLTAFADERTMFDAIDTEPIGYLTKPFKREELSAALHLVSRKEHNYNLGHGYLYRVKSQQLYYQNTLVPLSKKEHIMLQLLIEQDGKVLTMQHMEHTMWPNKTVSDSARRTFIHRLNNKLKHQIIITLPGIGYQLSIYSKIK